MPIPEWVIGYFLGIAVLQLIMFWYLIRRQERTTETVELEKGEVVCPRCDTRNDTRYRYCRSCVGELPGRRPSATGLTGLRPPLDPLTRPGQTYSSPP